MSFFEALCENKILEVLQNILIDTEKQSSDNLTVRSNESVNEDSSFLRSPILEPPQIAEDNRVLNDKLQKEESSVAEVLKDKEEKATNKLEEIEKIKSVSVNSLEDDVDIKEKIKINSIEILINIVTLTPSNYIIMLI